MIHSSQRFGKGFLLNYWFSDEEGGLLSVVGRTQATLDVLTLRLPVNTPVNPQQCLFHLQAIPEGDGETADGTIWAMIV